MAMTLPVYVRARSLTGFAELVHAHGGDVEALLQAVGLDADVLSRPDAVVPYRAGADLLDHAAENLGLADIGLTLGGQQDISVLGPVALTARYADDVREALQAIGRHLPNHTPGTQFSLQTEPLVGRRRCIATCPASAVRPRATSSK